MKLQDVETAAAHFLKAHELEPRSPAAAIDSAFALLQLQRLDEAECAARDAVALQPDNQTARRLLARIQAEKLTGAN